MRDRTLLVSHSTILTTERTLKIWSRGINCGLGGGESADGDGDGAGGEPTVNMRFKNGTTDGAFHDVPLFGQASLGLSAFIEMLAVRRVVSFFLAGG